jgi:hypothetical protein
MNAPTREQGRLRETGRRGGLLDMLAPLFHRRIDLLDRGIAQRLHLHRGIDAFAGGADGAHRGRGIDRYGWRLADRRAGLRATGDGEDEQQRGSDGRTRCHCIFPYAGTTPRPWRNWRLSHGRLNQRCLRAPWERLQSRG